MEKGLSLRSEMLLLMIKEHREIKNLNVISQMKRVTYSCLFNAIEELIKLDLIEKRIIGRVNSYKITKKGDNFCVGLIGSYKGE